METTPAPPTSARTVSVVQAAELTGLSKTAVQRRIDRGTLRAVLRDGRRRIPLSELERAGLIDASGAAIASLTDTGAAPDTRGPVSTPHSTGTGDAPAVALLIERLEVQAGQLAEFRLLTAQAESRVAAEVKAREALEADLHEARARIIELEALERTPDPPSDTSQGLHAAEGASRPWWAFWRSGVATPGDAAHSAVPGLPPPTS
jgi:excisionase family DNA binding protein